MQQTSESPQHPRLSGKILQMLIAVGATAVITGIALWPAYKATPGAAHDSVQAMHGLMGAVRAIHHWASAMLIVLGGVYVVVSLSTSAHKKPFHHGWLSALALMGVVLLLQLTGHLLPWDQQAVRTAAVEIGIAAGIPGVGPMQANLLRGGDSVGPATLNLWYVAHVLLLPITFLALLALLVSHLKRNEIQVGKVPILVLLVALIGMGVAVTPPLGQTASSADYGSFAAQPEWYILPLHSLLGIFQSLNPSLAFIGTAAIPGLVAVLLVAMPWLDRGERRLGKRLAIGLGLGAFILFALNLKEMAPPIGTQIAAVTATKAPVKVDPTLAAGGQTLFNQLGCGGCHMINGKGGKIGPDLTNEAARHAEIEWQILHLQAPVKTTPGSTMPAFDGQDAASLKALANYLVSKK